MRALVFALVASFAAVAAAPASAQGADSYAFCYADPPTYRSGTLVYTRVRFVSVGAIDLFEVGNALAETSRQVQGRQPSCWRYPNEQIAEAKRQEGMARDRARGYTVLESEWLPSRVSNVPVPMAVPVAAPPVVTPTATAPTAATITAAPVPDAASQPTAALPPVSDPAAASAREASVAADIDRVTSQQAPAAAPVAQAPVAAAPPPPPAPVPDPQTGAVANLNAGIVAAESARLNAAAQVQADYQRQLAEHARQVEEIRARNAKAQADYQAAVAACAAGDFSKCGGPPVPVKKK